MPPLVFWRIVLSSAAVIAFNLATLFLHIAIYRTNKPAIFPPSALGLAAAVLALYSAAIDLRSWNAPTSPSSRRWCNIQTCIQNLVCFFTLAALIFSLTIMTLQGIGAEGKYRSYFDVTTTSKSALAILSFLAIGSDAALGTIVAQLTWSPAHRFARSTMSISSLLLLAVGTVLIAVNRAPFAYSVHPVRVWPTVTFTLHQHVGALISATALMGFAISSTTKERNRINAFLTRFIRFYITLASLTSILCFVSILLTFRVLNDYTIKSLVQKGTLISDPVLIATAILLLTINFVAANYIQEPPVSHLAVETLDLASLTDAQRDAYAALITKHGKQLPSVPNGQAAISLMQAYTTLSLPNMSCLVLRVYRPPTAVHKMMRNDLSSKSVPYEDDRAWRQLDEEPMVLREIVVVNDNESKQPPKLTRTQQKKLARKRAAAIANGETPVDTPPPFSQTDLAFTAKLESTEALVLLTIIDHHDLTASVKGWPGLVLRYLLGSKSFAKPLCVRFGLLAFHWPFRQSTFYCSSSRRPVARSAAVRRAVAEWNKTQTRARRCAVLLDPTYEHEPAERAIVPSGWHRLRMPASHVVDLRGFAGKTVAEYLKAIKYRDQEGAFKRANGEVIESSGLDPEEEECQEAWRLWKKVAEKRGKEGYTPALTEPDHNFFVKMVEGSRAARSLMFLRVPEGEEGDRDRDRRYTNVASCVLFRLGDTLTSDLQGLDYEHARPLKAYFVMMQHVIAIALRDGYNFVDFGPTTAKAKLDIGCKSVPFIGAVYALSPVLSVAIRIAANKTFAGRREW